MIPKKCSHGFSLQLGLIAKETSENPYQLRV